MCREVDYDDEPDNCHTYHCKRCSASSRHVDFINDSYCIDCEPWYRLWQMKAEEILE